MKVRVRFFAQFRERYGGTHEIDLPEGATLLEAVRHVIGRERDEDSVMDRDDRLREFVILMKNGVRIEQEEVPTINLEDGDEVAVFPPVAGG
ncbi:MAG TPA: MoaD/ThiS family protein [Methanoregulaceae archaeon]|nr:MoaD/ThiS family protein [Methanoregulaceae archaeon]HOV66938.1 MoaD/ThiS family protein [Methanoregulaceae archaeon]HQJ87287.1 MoaD/ThiS family protein [Methanoregulaceae archaeon]